MTPYVLMEQQDWFEEEIDFLKAVIGPGMKIIDIGANYGLYTLALAKLAGHTGKIWAFEPTRETADCLRKSITDNALENIELIQAGLSNRTGEAKFFTCHNSEWNSLSEMTVIDHSSETISLLTLDGCREIYEWDDIDFLKLDAEGEELNILEKGNNFLESESPLIMYELKHNDKVNLPLINEFGKYGYDSYRYVPGLKILVPFDPHKPVDGFLLNLFACKKDRASGLESSGVLVTTQDYQECLPEIEVIKAYLEKLPYWETIEGKVAFENDPVKPYLETLSLYILAITGSNAANEKFNYLQTALMRVAGGLGRGEEKIEHLTTFSRIAFDAGERGLGIKILAILINRYFDDMNFEISGPFLPAAARFEKIDPGSDTKAWLVSSILEQFVIKHAYSTYFTQQQTLPLLKRLEQLGFINEEMMRRKKIVESTFPF